MARAVAPVKPAFLRPPPVREAPKEESKASGGAGGAVVAEKKSKRQLKRERKEVTNRSGGRKVFALMPQCYGALLARCLL